MAKELISPFAPLAFYNFVSAGAWCYILFNVFVNYPFLGQPNFYYATKDYVAMVQFGAIIEVLNSAVGIVRSPLLTTTAQVASRLLIVIGIFKYIPEAPATHSIIYITLLTAWSITEVVRYAFYFCTLTRADGAPRILVWLRYNLFLVLYPTGVASELLIIYSALPLAESQYSPLAKYILIFSMLTYLPGLPMLFGHMLAQRKKVMRAMREGTTEKKTN